MRQFKISPHSGWLVTKGSVLTEVSKDKHPQKKFNAAYIPLQKADFEMLAYTSLTASAPSLGKFGFYH